MEKWRIYMILAGMLLAAYNFSNINFDNISESVMALTGVFSSVVFVIMLILSRKK